MYFEWVQAFRIRYFFVALIFPELKEILIFSCDIKRFQVSGDFSAQRRTRSDTTNDVVVSDDLHAIAEFAQRLPLVTTLTSFDGLDREQPALLKDFIAAEYTDTHRRVCTFNHEVYCHSRTSSCSLVVFSASPSGARDH